VAKPITPEEMTAYVEATWNKYQEETWQEQEPVAWAHIEGNEIIAFETDKEECEACKYCVPLYATPPKREWVGLTKEEAREISLANRPYVIDMIAALEAKLKEKNT